MLDLFGYWWGVTFLTVVYAVLPVWILYLLTPHFVKAITEDDALVLKAQKWFWECITVHKNYDSRYDGTEYQYFLLKQEVSGEWVPAVSILASIILWVLSWMMIESTKVIGIYNLIDVTHSLASWATPALVWVGAVTTIYFGSILLGKRLWKLSQKVQKLSKHLEENKD
jgi:hypothetical protein